MKKSTKAALLSAFVFPGAGHIYLKKYLPGVALIGASLVAGYYLITKSVEVALQIAEKIQSGEVQLDATAITELVSKQITGTETQLINIATPTIIICWVIGIIDSYRVGRMRDKNEQNEPGMYLWSE
jgi:TM2 domain-containing membrane protein YozV